jgi:hypothetical protein
MHGIERKLAVGAYPNVSLAEAREARDAARKHLASDVEALSDQVAPRDVARLGDADASLQAVAR